MGWFFLSFVGGGGGFFSFGSFSPEASKKEVFFSSHNHTNAWAFPSSTPTFRPLLSMYTYIIVKKRLKRHLFFPRRWKDSSWITRRRRLHFRDHHLDDDEDHHQDAKRERIEWKQSAGNRTRNGRKRKKKEQWTETPFTLTRSRAENNCSSFS